MATEAVFRTPACAAVRLDVRGAVDPAERDLAVAMVGAVLTRHSIADSAVRVRLSSGARCGGPGLVQVNLRVCGAPARIQVPGPSVAQAVAAAAHRLDRQIHRLTSMWEAWPWPDPQRRPLGVPGEERIARVKRVRLRTAMVCQATATMNAMDYDFHLFVDGGTGEDAIVYRSGPTGVRLARQRSMHPPRVPAGQPVTINPRKVPVITGTEAARQLCAGWLPFLFFTDPASGRGNVLYRRYDAALGLVAPDQVGGPG
jgi:hypothetical protein